MICRKCGAEIADNSIRCPECGIKVNMYCPSCRTLNLFGEKYCVNCGSELLLYCSVCGSTNIYYANDCRKCHSPLLKGGKSPLKSAKDISVVENFSSEEAVYTNKTGGQTVVITENIKENSLPVIEKVQNDYAIEQVENVFGSEEGLIKSQNQDVSSDNNSDAVSEETEEEIEVLNEAALNTEETALDIETPTSRENLEETEKQNEEFYHPQIKNDIKNIKIEVHPEIVINIANTIKNSLQKHIIAVKGEEGSGKSAILKQVSAFLAEDGWLSLYGSCTPLIQITSFGFFQDAFLRIMGFPPYAKSSEAFVNDFKNSYFSKVFSFLNNNELTLFLNIFYPSLKDKFENIIENKMKIFSILEKVIKSFLINSNLIILIDNFELLDGASYEFIVHMLKNGFFNNRLKLVVAYAGNKDIKSYFELTNEEEKIFETVETKKSGKEELLDSVENNMGIRLEEILDKDTLDELLLKAEGNAVKMIQETAFLFDSAYLEADENGVNVNNGNSEIIKYGTFDELIKKRVNTLHPIIKNLLFMAAIMGYRFSTSILCLSINVPVEKAEEIVDFLIKNLYIQRVDNYTCEFISLNLWKIIYKEAKSDLLYKENAQKLYLALKPLVLSSNLQKLISCRAALTSSEEFLIWQNTARITAKLGDTNLYVIALKQCLKLFEETQTDNDEIKKQTIYEEMGKLLCEKSPKEAITYLANVLDEYIKCSDVKKVIDISSYFVKSCYLTGNYFGVVEAVDSVTEILEKTNSRISSLETALIKTRKLNALLNIGNCEQIVSLVKDEILPEISVCLSSNQFDSDYKNIILSAWYNSKIILAKAMLLQGNTKADDIINEIEQSISEYNYNTAYYKLYINIIKALSKTVKGELHKSIEILNNISVAYKTTSMDLGLLARWNLVNIINRVLLHRNNDLKSDLFELASFANNINEHFIKNIVKLILGYVLKLEGNSEKAEEIYNEQTVYFAKEKITLGALFAWSLLAKQYLEQGKLEKALDTAVKSLEISQGPKVNNYIFTICFQKLIAEIYVQKHDFDAAKMYFEKSIVIAKEFNLKYQLIELYISYAKFLQDLMKHKRIHSNENVASVKEMYKNAIEIGKELALQNMVDFAKSEYFNFKTYCQLNSVDI